MQEREGSGIPASFSARTTPQGLVLRVSGEEGSTVVASAALTALVAVAGFAGPGLVCFGLAALLAVFTAVLGVQSLTAHELELAFDEVRLVRRLGSLTLRTVRVPLAAVSGVRVDPDSAMALRVIELSTEAGPVRILADGHTAEDVEWLRDTLEVMAQAAHPSDG